MREVHGWRRAARWAIAILGGSLGLVALAAIVGVLVLQTGWGRGVLKAQIEARLDRTFAGGATIGHVSGNPLSDLVVEDIVIHGPDNQPAVTVDRLTVKLPLLPLVSRQLRVEKIIAEGVDVHAKKLANGELNLANMMKPSGEPSTWSVALPNVAVHRGHVLVEIGEGIEPIDIDDLEIQIGAKLPFGGPTDANAQLTGTWRQKRAPISIGAVIHDDEERFEVRNAGVRVGDVRVVALGVTLPKSAFSKAYDGTVIVHAPAKAVRHLVPAAMLPDDVALAANARSDGRLTHISVNGTLGDSEISALGRADVQARLASAVLLASELELRTVTKGAVDGRGSAMAALQIDGAVSGELPKLTGIVTARSSVPSAPPLDAVIAIDSRGEHARAIIGAATDGDIQAGIAATVRKRGDVLELERADLVATTRDLRRAAIGSTPLRGVLNATLHAEGTLAPSMDLAIVGHANGRRLRVLGVSAETLALHIDAAHVPARPVGTARLEMLDVERGALQLGNLTVSAANRRDGKLHVSVRSEPRPAPWRFDVDALVTMGETIVVELQRHFVRAAGGSTWSGNSGVLRVGPRKVELRGLRSDSNDGNFSADATYVRAGRNRGDLEARLDASFDLGSIYTAHEGHIDAHVDVKRAGKRFTGVVVADAKGVSLDARTPITLDASTKIEARADQLLAHVDVKTAKSGTAKLVLDVDAPRDITNVREWSTLGRDAVRTVKVTLNCVSLQDIAKLAHAPAMSGCVDGVVDLSPAHAGGSIALRGVQVPETKGLGSINADLKVEQVGIDEMKTTLTARLVPTPNATAASDITQGGEARLFVDARFGTPDRIFDPAAWLKLGARAFRGGTIRAERLAFQPGTLERFGIVSAMRGELAVGAEVDEGMKALRFAVNVYELRGGLFAQPIGISVTGAVDDQSTRVKADVRHDGVTLVHAATEVPITLDELRADPQAIASAPLSGRAQIDHVPAKTLMNMLGTSQITGGTLDGTIDLGGTVAVPTIDANIVARGVTVPDESARQVQYIKQLTVAATWDGKTGEVAVDGDQSAGGKLKIRAIGALDRLDQMRATVYATKLDIAPLVAFMPGPAGALGGQMEASFALRGADPRTAELVGSLHVTDGRIPIAPTVGTLFKGDVRVDVRNNVLGLNLTGKLGQGDVTVTANAPLDGVTPKSGNAKVTLRNVRLISTGEPILTGSIEADVARVGTRWRSNVRVERLTVKVPEGGGRDLAPVGAPPDLVWGGERIHHGTNKGNDAPGTLVKDTEGEVELREPSKVAAPMEERKRSSAPTVVAHVHVRNVFIESEEVRGLVDGRLVLSIGDSAELVVVGSLSLSRGVVDLFGRRYDIDRAVLRFDGSTDPLLDIRITRDFPEVTTITDVRGRMSKPDLVLSSNPPRFSQAELLGFLLGGEPGGDPQNAPSATERVAGAGASLIGNKIGGYMRRALPVDLDVLRYEAETSTSSAAITVGTWITDSLFLAYRRRLSSRPDENAGEGEVEYWIRRRLVAEGVIGDRGFNSADLLWRRRW